MPQDKEIAAQSGLFARKGTARAASGLRLLEPQAEGDQPVPAATAANGAESHARAVGDLAEAASLAPGGFTAVARQSTAPIADAPHGTETAGPVVGGAAGASAVGPAEIDSALADAAEVAGDAPLAQLAAYVRRRDVVRRLLIASGFVAALVACVGVGYGVSLLVGG